MSRINALLGTAGFATSLALAGCFSNNTHKLDTDDSVEESSFEVSVDEPTDLEHDTHSGSGSDDTGTASATTATSSETHETAASTESSDSERADSSSSTQDPQPQDTGSASETQDTGHEPDCEPLASTGCGEDGSVHAFNSCGEDDGIVQECPVHSLCVELEHAVRQASCTCTHHWTGQDCEICPQNWDAFANCNSCAHRWTGSLCDVCPNHFTSSSNCSACQAGWAEGDCNTCVRYADATSTAASATGLSWATAFKLVRDAIDAAAQAISTGAVESCEVWVAGGTYYTFLTSANDTVTLRNGVDVYGGFRGDETSKASRNPKEVLTVLSGKRSSSSPMEERACHVLTATPSSEVIVDGLIISDGSASNRSCPEGSGGGAWVKNARVHFSDCAFMSNQASYGGALQSEGALAHITLQKSRVMNNNSSKDGAAVHVIDGASLIAKTSTFTGNATSMGGTGSGGAIFAGAGANLIVTDCVFERNATMTKGSAIAVRTSSSAQVERSTFVGHWAGPQGGTLAASDGAILNVQTSLFISNAAQGTAVIGAAYGSTIHFANCTVAKIVDSNAEPVFRSDNSDLGKGNLSLTNCIVWTPGNPLFTNASGATTTVAYTDTSDSLQSGAGNKAQIPLFAGQPLYSGYWKASSASIATYETVFTKADGEEAWTPGELEGAVIWFDTSNNSTAVVTKNTARSLTLAGSLTSSYAGKSYAIYDYALGAGSPCIDAGTTTGTTPLTDIEGTSFSDVPGIGVAGVKHDMGAYEFVP
ncbi:MAG: hypothetical protein MUC50_22685 [Myxococcota bacterium]|nr:hypothetical protein [Myxococcota bacterium]